MWEKAAVVSDGFFGLVESCDDYDAVVVRWRCCRAAAASLTSGQSVSLCGAVSWYCRPQQEYGRNNETRLYTLFF